MEHMPANLQSKPAAAAAMAATAAAGGGEAGGGGQGGGSAPAAAVAGDNDALRVPIGTTVEEAEKNLILRTLEHTRNNKTRAAEILGISLKTLHNKLKEYGAKDAV
jgi:DNA-binding NtrC family response regulator